MMKLVARSKARWAFWKGVLIEEIHEEFERAIQPQTAPKYLCWKPPAPAIS